MYKRIRISFLHAGSILIDEGDWDDYEIFNGFLVIKKGEAWIALYNMNEIFSVVLEKRITLNASKKLILSSKNSKNLRIYSLS